MVVRARASGRGSSSTDARISHVRRRHNIAIGKPNAEQIKFEVGSAARAEERGAGLRGKN